MSKESNNNSSSGGVGFVGLLGLLFIALKLTGYIDWSWWYVLMPLYAIPALLVIGIVGYGLWWLLALSIREFRFKSANKKRQERLKKLMQPPSTWKSETVEAEFVEEKVVSSKSWRPGDYLKNIWKKEKDK